MIQRPGLGRGARRLLRFAAQFQRAGAVALHQQGFADGPGDAHEIAARPFIFRVLAQLRAGSVRAGGHGRDAFSRVSAVQQRVAQQ